MIKFRLYLDKDSETEWLNQMVEKGWAMKRFFAGFYQFERCEPGQYIYQVDFGSRLYHVSDDYREFMEDAGVEIVQLWGYWVILRKPAADGPFELYTDVDSTIGHYTKIRRMFHGAILLETLCLIGEIWVGIQGEPMGYAAVCLIGAFIAGCINESIRIRNIIEELRERKGNMVYNKTKKGFSSLLTMGLLMNACALALIGSVSDYIVAVIQVIAIMMMAAGLYISVRSARGRQ